jgi:stearoyl-CoA desaturase (delta-9 desaturase)
MTSKGNETMTRLTRGEASKSDPAPIYSSFSELLDNGFRWDAIAGSFIVITHLIMLVGAPLAYFYAPSGFWQVMLGWTLCHALFGSLSTTVYTHRLISHGAARYVSWPVHIVFGFFGQVLAVQGSARQWSANHVIHHSVDRTGKHELDPYSATWFDTTWRNFLWSHIISHLFCHPESQEFQRAFKSKSSRPLLLQERLYLPLFIGLNFILPLVIGFTITGTLIGAVCLMMASICGFILAQHNTWTVNSVTHMWGFTKGAFSSAKNNYIWMGPLGEGNHHADHHDFARDYRNGFGWSGWFLDPTRYIILLLNAFGLVKGLQRATKKQEAEIIALRQLNAAHATTQSSLWQKWEGKLVSLKSEWVDAAQRWETFKAKKSQLESISLPTIEMRKKLTQIKLEMNVAKRNMRARKQAFFDALYEMSALQFAS